MLFFDQRNYFQQKETMAELDKLETKKKYYQEQIEKAKAELTDLQNDPAALEKFARERYLMKRDGEDLFSAIGHAARDARQRRLRAVAPEAWSPRKSPSWT